MYNTIKINSKTKVPVGKKKNQFYFAERVYYRQVYLKSDHWKELKAKKLEKTPDCENCGRKGANDAHHLIYKNLYDVSIEDLKTLCRICHTIEHKKPKKRQKNVMKASTIKRHEQEKIIFANYDLNCQKEREKIKKDNK